MPKTERRAMTTTVVQSTWLTPGMVRLVVAGDDLEGFGAGEFTDHYVKCRFGERTRSYTVRDWDPALRQLTLDFVVHGDRGLAGPWAAQARPGDELQLMGPGGGYTPRPDAAWHLMVGDDSVIPAIAASLQRVDAGVPVFAVIEVDGVDHEQPLHSPGELHLRWLYRDAGPGEDPELMLDAVRDLELPAGPGQAFVHGEAQAVLLVRRHLLRERGLSPQDMSATGYWKLRRTDEEWRAEKRDWMREAEADVPV